MMRWNKSVQIARNVICIMIAMNLHTKIYATHLLRFVFSRNPIKSLKHERKL